jgi:light-dependent protochlorophyllide reductase
VPAKTAIVTGANSGLGLECARALLASDPEWHVVLAVRDAERGRAAAQQIDGTSRCTVSELDLASLASVQRFVMGFRELDVPPLHAIVCNAGIQVTTEDPQLTPDGIEVTFGVNHLGHFALVEGLLDQLQVPARIIVVASDTHDPRRLTGMPHPAYTTADQLAHPHPGEKIAGRRRYTTSKLCNMLFVYELDRRLEHGARGITVNAFNPGLMPGSGLARDAGRVQQFAWRRIMPALRVLPQVRSPRESGVQLARLASDTEYDGVTGRYFDGARDVQSSRESYDLATARELWDGSDALVGPRESAAAS